MALDDVRGDGHGKQLLMNDEIDARLRQRYRTMNDRQRRKVISETLDSAHLTWQVLVPAPRSSFCRCSCLGWTDDGGFNNAEAANDDVDFKRPPGF